MMQSINVLSHGKDPRFLVRECMSRVQRFLSFACGSEIHPKIKRCMHHCGLISVLRDMQLYFTYSFGSTCTPNMHISVVRAHQYAQEESQRLYMADDTISRRWRLWLRVGLFTDAIKPRTRCIDTINEHVRTIRSAFMRAVLTEPLMPHRSCSPTNDREPGDVVWSGNKNAESPRDHRFIESMVFIDNMFN